MNFVLFSFREFHNLSENELAERLSISLQEYQFLENGVEVVNPEIAMGLSVFYKAPPQIFLINNPSNHFSFIYSNCYFNNGNGYVNNLNNQFDYSKEERELVVLVKEELKILQELNQTLTQNVIKG